MILSIFHSFHPQKLLMFNIEYILLINANLILIFAAHKLTLPMGDPKVLIQFESTYKSLEALYLFEKV